MLVPMRAYDEYMDSLVEDQDMALQGSEVRDIPIPGTDSDFPMEMALADALRFAIDKSRRIVDLLRPPSDFPPLGSAVISSFQLEHLANMEIPESASDALTLFGLFCQVCLDDYDRGKPDVFKFRYLEASWDAVQAMCWLNPELDMSDLTTMLAKVVAKLQQFLFLVESCEVYPWKVELTNYLDKTVERLENLMAGHRDSPVTFRQVHLEEPFDNSEANSGRTNVPAGGTFTMAPGIETSVFLIEIPPGSERKSIEICIR